MAYGVPQSRRRGPPRSGRERPQVEQHMQQALACVHVKSLPEICHLQDSDPQIALARDTGRQSTQQSL